MAIISSGITTLTDLNDAIISGTKPVNPTVGTLWIDSSTTPAVLKIYKNGAWVTQDLDLDSLDPDMAESIRNVVATIGNMSNDNLLDYKERQIIKDDLTEILGKVMLDTETVLPTVAQLDTLTKGSFYSTRQNALNAGLEKTNSVYVDTATQYQNLKTYLESLTPVKPWNTDVANKDRNVTVVKNTFRDKWLQYYLATEKLSLATTEKIKEVQEELDGKIDEVSLRDKTEILSGNPVFTDKSDDAVVHVGVDGKSVQNAGSGINLAPDPKYWELKGATSYSDGVITIPVGNSNTVTFWVRWDGKKAGQTLSLDTVTGSGFLWNTSYFLEDKTTSVLNTGGIHSSNGYVVSQVLDRRKADAMPEIDSNVKWVKHTFSGTTQYTTSEVKIKNVMITSDRSIDYEPPAPSPDYPIAINSLDKSFDIVSSVGKENLVKSTLTAHTPYNSAPVLNSNGDLTTTISGTTKYLTVAIVGLTPKNTEYTVSGIMKRNGIPIKRAEWVHTRLQTQSGLGTLIVNDETGYFECTQKWTGASQWVFHSAFSSFIAGDTVTIEKFTMVEGIVATPWSQNLTTLSYDTQSPTLYKTNILLSEPLRSVGDVKDRLFLDTDGLWKVERNVGEESLSGASSFSTTGALSYYGEVSTNMWLIPKQAMTGFSTSNVEITTHFTHQNNVWSDNTLASGTSVNTGRQFHIRVPNILLGVLPADSNSVRNQKYKNWFEAQKDAGTPVIVQYQLAIPTIETLSAEQQTKLNNIQSFKGGNYVYTLAGVVPNLNARFKSNAWYRTNVLGEQLTYGNRNWARNGNLAYLLEDSAWSGYYKGTVREIVDISSDAPPFKNALHIKQTTSGIAGIIDAVIWEGAEANVLTGQSISMATWLKYQNVANSDLVMQVQVTGKKSDGTFVYDYPKVFSSTGTDMTWQRRTGTVKINLFEGATEITRVMFRLGFAKAGTGEFWATGIQLETGTALGDWSPNPDDVQGDLDATKAQLILTEKQVALRVTKGNVINEVNVDSTGVRIKGEKFTVDADTEFNANLTMNKGVIKSADGGTVLDLNNNTLSLDKPFSIGNTKSATTDDVTKAVDAIDINDRNLTKNTSHELKTATFKTWDFYFDYYHGVKAGETFTARIWVEPKKFPVKAMLEFGVTNNWSFNKQVTGNNIINVGESGYVTVTTTALTDGWVRQSIRHTVNQPTDNIVDYKETKMQRGTKATDWTPALEDVSKEIKDVSDTANSLKDFTNTAFSDGIIQIAEAQAISEHLNTLLKENEDLSSQYVGIYGNTSLTGTPKTNLYNSKIAYNTAYTNIVSAINNAISGNKTTPAQKADVDAKFITYTTALKTLTLRMNESMTVISETLANVVAVAKANLAEVNAKAHADGKVTAEEKRAIDDAKAKLVQAQSYADSAVNNLEIGGRNLLPLSSLRDSASFNSFGVSDVTASLVDGEYTLLNRTSSNSGRAMFSKNAKMDILNNFAIGDNLTISADVYVESLAIDGSTIFVRFNNSSGGMIGDAWVGINTTTPKNQWVRISGTYTIPQNADLSKTDALRIGISGVARFRVKNINVSKGNKDNGWSLAPEDIQAGIDSAQTEATNAKNSANTANQLLADLSNDGILTPVEKKSVKKEWDIIVSEKAKIELEGTEYAIVTEKNLYTHYYTALSNYITPLLANLNINSTIVATTFRAYFKNYYDARQDLLNAITSKAKTLADSAQGTADNVKGIITNFDSAIINANPIFLDWSGDLPAGYSGITGGSTNLSKVTSGNGMGNAVKFSVPAGSGGLYLTPFTVTTAPFYDYVTIEFTFKLESGTVDGAGVLFRYLGNGNTDHRIHIKDIVPSPTINKWYTVTKTIKQSSTPAGFTGYQVYPMAGWTTFGSTITTKVIQYDSLKSRQATEQEINAYESSIMIADMSSDNKITPLEKVQLKKEWATIASERASLDGLAGTYNLGAEKTNMTNAYNTLSSALNGTNGILANMTTTSTVVATTFRAQFDDYYEKKALLQKKVNEIAKTLADKAQSDVDNIEIGGINLVIRNGEWSYRYLTGSETYPNPMTTGTKSSTMKELISVTVGENIMFTKSSPFSDDYWRVSWLNASKVYVSRFVNTSNKFMMTVPSGVAYMWVSFPTDSNPKIEKGNKATGWSPAPEDVDASIEEAKRLANNASTLAGTKAETYTSTPTIPYKSGDVWRNGSAVYISTATRSSGSFTSSDWVLVGDVTSNNTARDVTNVGGTLATTIRDRATNGNTAYASTSLWKMVGKVTFDGGNLEADTITSGAIKSDVALINKLFVSDANINALTAKTAFINTVKSIDLSADRITAGTISGVNSAWNLNTGNMLFRNPSTGDTLNLNQGEISFKNGAQGRTLQYNSGGLLLRPDNNNTGTALNTGFILEGGVTFVQFNNRAGTVQHGRLQMTSDTAVLRIPNGADFLIQDMNGLQTNIGANIFKTVHGTGEVIYMQQNRIYTIRDGNRNIFLEPNGTGSVVAGNGGGTRWNMVASDFVKQSTRDSKTDIKPIETKGLDVIGRLNPVSYKKKDKVSQGIVETELGFIAEDSLEVATVDGLGIYDSHITAYLVKAVQELNAELKEIKK